LNRFALIAQLSWFMPVIAGATRFQPVYAGDVADAVMAGLRANAPGATFELGGPRVLSMRELLVYVLAQTGRADRWLVNVPVWLARLQAAVLEHLPGKLLTRDQLLMLQRDNVVAAGAPGLADLGIVPTPMELVVPAYLRRFRKGGQPAKWATA
jgi:NADH dehydrogenase